MIMNQWGLSSFFRILFVIFGIKGEKFTTTTSTTIDLGIIQH